MSMAWPCASVVPQFNDFDVGLVENRPKLYLDFILPVLRLTEAGEWTEYIICFFKQTFGPWMDHFLIVGA